uniref:Uncharacterized protein n=1 Tax=Anopheles coluzzii TaxID=1518534 RepID=A0A6E8W837_ANOCL
MCDSECVAAPAVVSPLAAPPTNGMPTAVSPSAVDPSHNIGSLVEAINPAVQLASSLSAHSMHAAPMQPEGQPGPAIGAGEYVSAQELEMENHWLREKLKEVSADRDRLLCEVANLRLELDMAELKRLPEHRPKARSRVVSLAVSFFCFVVFCYYFSRVHDVSSDVKDGLSRFLG